MPFVANTYASAYFIHVVLKIFVTTILLFKRVSAVSWFIPTSANMLLSFDGVTFLVSFS